MSDFIRTGSGFTKALALGSVQHGAVIESSLLPPTIGISEPMVSLAAGKWGVPKHCLKWEVVPDQPVCWETQINWFYNCTLVWTNQDPGVRLVDEIWSNMYVGTYLLTYEPWTLGVFSRLGSSNLLRETVGYPRKQFAPAPDIGRRCSNKSFEA